MKISPKLPSQVSFHSFKFNLPVRLKLRSGADLNGGPSNKIRQVSQTSHTRPEQICSEAISPKGDFQ